ncbi:hypothetical protein OK351_05240 [Glutamicibacter sp. MNS18]|uniref:hypothetical protein n=1 Tax=Glutamicibacter sp. MNS18 TaxID=2989817 RepID=UPI00223598D7|nr:hypothetical protein [Glutamicibacter sp. MNS18]MCW4464911.1 hypothetical protein [Glutamicibacter sp. MNS18]
MITRANVIPLLERYLDSYGQFSCQWIDDLEMKTIREADSGRLFIFKCSLDDIIDRINIQEPGDLFRDDTRDGARMTLFAIEVWEAMEFAADGMKFIRVETRGVRAE